MLLQVLCDWTSSIHFQNTPHNSAAIMKDLTVFKPAVVGRPYSEFDAMFEAYQSCCVSCRSAGRCCNEDSCTIISMIDKATVSRQEQIDGAEVVRARLLRQRGTGPNALKFPIFNKHFSVSTLRAVGTRVTAEHIARRFPFYPEAISSAMLQAGTWWLTHDDRVGRCARICRDNNGKSFPLTVAFESSGKINFVNTQPRDLR
eukprot:m.1643512 g.1643512  ORF g.1643512 m.1643512 type:complete len:202 (+) comp58581_c0_seq1:155-760(+)